MHNPTIYKQSEELFTLWDDCLSFPEMLVRVKRHKSISVKWYNEKGEQQDWKDLPEHISELLQHEIDHLNGKTSFDSIDGQNAVIHRDVYLRNKNHYDGLVDYKIVPTINENE